MFILHEDTTTFYKVYQYNNSVWRKNIQFRFRSTHITNVRQPYGFHDQQSGLSCSIGHGRDISSSATAPWHWRWRSSGTLMQLCIYDSSQLNDPLSAAYSSTVDLDYAKHGNGHQAKIIEATLSNTTVMMIIFFPFCGTGKTITSDATQTSFCLVSSRMTSQKNVAKAIVVKQWNDGKLIGNIDKTVDNSYVV